MSKFRKNKSGGMAPISTASLPDIVFMLLFFFMVTTVMRETELLVKNSLPSATEIKKLERKSLVDYIYIGEPKKSVYGTEARIQLNDAFAKIEDIQEWVVQGRDERDEKEVPLLTVSIKADKDTKMGLVTDVKQELRKIQAYKINYSTKKRIKK